MRFEELELNKNMKISYNFYLTLYKSISLIKIYITM